MTRKSLLPVFLFAAISLLWPCYVNSDDHLPAVTPINIEAIKAPGLELLHLLRNSDFGVLDQQLNGLQAAYENDTMRENDLAQAFNWLAIPYPELEKLFVGWQQSHQESYAANVALGSYYRALAGQWRGNNYVEETPAYRLKMMDEYLSKAGTYLKKSLSLAAKPTFSYSRLIALATYKGDRALADQWMAEALKADPYCVRPRDTYMRMLEPRWGGSTKTMMAFAEETRMVKHPKLEKAARQYDGRISWYEGFQQYLAANYVGALNEYNKALSHEDSSLFRLARAQVYKLVGQNDLALADIDKSLVLSPSSPDAYYLRAEALFDKRRIDEALKDLRFAAEFGNLRALTKLGSLSFFGEAGVPVNLQEGVHLWEKAAYFWDEYASYNLGAAYERGLGVREDKVAAVRYYRIAADQGNANAINDLGLMLWYGRGTNANKEGAIALWIEGAQKGVWQSKHNLQFFLSPGERLKLVFRYPAILLEDKMLLSGAAIWLFIVLIIVIRIVRRANKRDNGLTPPPNLDFRQ